MSSSAITTVLKMMESLPENVQEQVAEHLREYIQELQDEIQWDKSFKKTQQQLVDAARRAKQEIAEGKAQPMSKNLQEYRPFGLCAGEFTVPPDFNEPLEDEEISESAVKSFRQGWDDAMTGNTVPVSQLWEGIDADTTTFY